MANVTVSAPKIALFDRIRDLMDTARANLALYREYQKTFAELDGLSDRDLADIGINRADIADIARTHVYGA